MIIHPPEISQQDGQLCLSARVEMQNQLSQVPNELWFKFPENYRDHITVRSDSFATSLLLLAMYYNEALVVKGEISPHLAYGLGEWQQIFHACYPKQFRIVDLQFDRLETTTKLESQGKVAAAFSGGLDSLYTLWRHIPSNQPILQAQLTHAIFIHGFDIALSQSEKYRILFERYSGELEPLGVTLLNVQTNAALFSRFRIKWELTHGGVLIGTALLFSRLLGRFYVNSTHAYRDFRSDPILGSSILTDHWLSTETLEIIHFGSSHQRIEKMAALAGWPIAQRTLRVCSNPNNNDFTSNCGRCTRCLLSKTRLELLGSLSKFVTFKEPFNYRDLFHLALALDSFPDADIRILESSLKVNRWDIAIPMALIYILDGVKQFLIYALLAFIPRERRYRLKRWFFEKRQTE
jgi:hypothetical protein